MRFCIGSVHNKLITTQNVLLYSNITVACHDFMHHMYSHVLQQLLGVHLIQQLRTVNLLL